MEDEESSDIDLAFDQNKLDDYLHNDGNHHIAGLITEDFLDKYFFYMKPDEQIFSKATLDDNFEDNAVIIVLNKALSRDDRTFKAMDFGDIGALYVEDLDRLSDSEHEYAEALWEAERNLVLAEFAELTESAVSNEDFLGIQEVYFNVCEKADANTLVNFDEYRRILLIRLDQNSKENVLNVIQQLQKCEYIHIAEPNYIFEPDDSDAIRPNDPYFQLPITDVNHQWSVERISLPQAWSITTASSTVNVGIVGHGIDATHSELSGRVSALQCGKLTDSEGMGTMQAGIIGALGDNGKGIAGIAWNVQLISVGVGRNFQSHVNGIHNARIAGIPILTRSLDGGFTGSAVYSSVKNYTGLFINSAGNENQNTDSNPRFFDFPNVIIVGASDMNDGRSIWNDDGTLSSNLGADSVHLFAPSGGLIDGVLRDIRTTYPNNLYNFYGGTSAAAPHVAGVAALMLCVNSDLSPQQVRDIILDTVDQIPEFVDISISGGRLNAYNAVRGAAANNGWVRRGSFWCFYTRGVRNKGWLEQRNEWYFLHETTGCMQTGWVRYRGGWYFLNQPVEEVCHSAARPEGAMLTGWLNYSGNYYYLNPPIGRVNHIVSHAEGVMLTGWLNYNNNYYYLNPASGMANHLSSQPEGSMFRNGQFMINGIMRQFNSLGRWIE